MKKIGILHYSAPPIIGGVESVIGHHARLFSAAGHPVRILAGRGTPDMPAVEYAEIPLVDSRHPEVLRIKAGLDRGTVPPDFSDLIGKIKEQLQEHLQWCDILAAHNVCSLNKNLALTAALMEIAGRRAGPKLVIWHHDLAFTSARYRDELHEGYPWSLLKTAWPGVSRHVVVSQLRRRELSSLMGLEESEIQVIPNGVDIGEFLNLGEEALEIIRSLDLFQAAPLLLQPVRITRRKNLELSLRCLAFLKQEFPAARLLVTGPLGAHNPANLEYFGELTALRSQLGLEGSVHFMVEESPKTLPDETIADLYRVADGLLLTSQEEGFGIPILEAGLVGLPVFCTNIPSLRELAGETADSFSPGEDPRKVAKLIFTRLKSDGVTQMRQKVRQSYTWEVIFREYLRPLLNSL